jgi:hypothetical protein
MGLSGQIDRIIWIAGKFACFEVQSHKNIRAKTQEIIIRANLICRSISRNIRAMELTNNKSS